MGHTYIGSEHLLLGLVSEDNGPSFGMLTQRGVTMQQVSDKVLAKSRAWHQNGAGPGDISQRGRQILENAIDESRMRADKDVTPEHILMALLKKTQSGGAVILRDLRVTPLRSMLCGRHERVRDGPYKARTGYAQSSKAPKITCCSKYAKDLTEMAAEGRLDPVIGRGAEIDRVIQILCRRTRTTPALSARRA